MKKISALVAIITLSLLVGCSQLGNHVAIEQGNIVTPAMLSQVKLGMDKKQVEFILGNPLLETPFTANRYEYVYWYAAPNQMPHSQTIALIFRDSRLVEVKGQPNSNILPTI